MYGLLINAISEYLQKRYGEEKWEKVRRKAGIDLECFGIHSVYSEAVIPNISEAAAQVLGKRGKEEIMGEFGQDFVSYVGRYGYDNILKVLGRNMRDFLNGLDNLHEYLRFSYRGMRAPSFFVESESKDGLTLHYRTRRRGYTHYVMGQIRSVGRLFYNTDVQIEVIKSEDDNPPGDITIHVIFSVKFDNSAYRDPSRLMEDSVVDNIPLRSELLFELFPFHLVLGRDMVIVNVGSALAAVIPDAVGRPVSDVFVLARPLTTLCWEEVLLHTNNVFELVSIKTFKQTQAGNSQDGTDRSSLSGKVNDVTTKGNDVKKGTKDCEKEGSDVMKTNDVRSKRNDVREGKVNGNNNSKGTTDDSGSDCGAASGNGELQRDNHLHVKGQMLYMKEWESIMFLGTPLMTDLDEMFKAGLFINDLSMHDCSRDLVLAGTQQSAELKLALDQEQAKSQLLQQSMRNLDEERRRTDRLLYQMIPKPVADMLRRGDPAIATCQAFSSVTILFSDVVGFTTICSKITPMQVVSMLNLMYTEFDELSEKHSVYKVETIGDAYMAVAGAPTVSNKHGPSMCDMALGMLEAMSKLVDPSTGDNMRIRVGIHTGPTVAGVVGIKMPRYCLFGDTVNTASRMESSGKAMKIHISETTRHTLEHYPYRVQEREQIEVKGKGSMKTYWLLGRDGDPVLAQQQTETTQVPVNPSTQRSSLAGHTRRPLYSPVSFEDISTDSGALVHSPNLSPQHTDGVSRTQRSGSTHMEQVCPGVPRRQDCQTSPRPSHRPLTPTPLSHPSNGLHHENGVCTQHHHHHHHQRQHQHHRGQQHPHHSSRSPSPPPVRSPVSEKREEEKKSKTCIIL